MLWFHSGMESTVFDIVHPSDPLLECLQNQSQTVNRNEERHLASQMCFDKF